MGHDRGHKEGGVTGREEQEDRMLNRIQYVRPVVRDDEYRGRDKLETYKGQE